MVPQEILDEAFATYVQNGGDMDAVTFMSSWREVDPQRTLVRNAFATRSLRERITMMLKERGGEYPTYAISNSINMIVAETFGKNAFSNGLKRETYPEAGWATVAQVRAELIKMEKEGLVKRNGMSSNSIVWKLKK